MPLPVGATVVVRAFGNKRGVVIAVSPNGRCQVRIGGITMWCNEGDLTVPPESRKKPVVEKPPNPAADEIAPPGRVDLHGLVVEEALARVVDEINRSLLRGADRVEIVHGKGSGRIREALHRHLATMSVVVTFRVDPRNTGVTLVLL